MKRIALIVCGLLVLAISNTAEARRSRGYNNNYASNNYSSQPTTQVTAYRPVTPAATPTTAQDAGESSEVSTASYATNATTTPVATSSPAAASSASSATFSTATAQGVANIMASRNQVG